MCTLCNHPPSCCRHLLAAYPLVAYWLFDYYSDDAVIPRHYDGIRSLVEHHIAEAATGWGGLTQRYGDWCAVYKGAGDGCTHISDATGYFYYIVSLDALVVMAQAIGRVGDVTRYTGIAQAARQQFHAKLWINSTCLYGGGTPVETAVALQLGVADPSSLPCIAAALRKYYTATTLFPGHMDGGILSTKHVWPALSDVGQTDLALTMALQTDFPSYGWWIANGGTTLFERWQDIFSAPLKDSSFNHIMFGGVSQWLHSHVVGIRRAGQQRPPPAGSSGSPPPYSTRGWRDLVMGPAAAPDVRVGYASESMITAGDGLVASSWALPPSDSGPSVCGTAPDGSSLTLTCVSADGNPAPGGSFASVLFASYGQPAGGCFGPLRASPTCNSNVSVPVVTSACVGKSSCTIPVSAVTFGNADPCPGHPKRLVVKLSGAGGCALASLSVSATVPVNGAATVLLPLNSTLAASGGAAAASAVVFESGIDGSDRLVWAGGRGGYVPGTDGVTNVQAVTTGTGAGSAIAVSVGSGAYAFTVMQVPAS